MTHRTKLVAALSAALVLATGTAAWAQTPAAPAPAAAASNATGPGTRGMDRHGPGHERGDRHARMHEQRMDHHRGGPGGALWGPPNAAELKGRLDTARSTLKITPAQDSAWQKFSTTLVGQVQTFEARRAEMDKLRAAAQASGQKPDAATRDKLRTEWRQQAEAQHKAREEARNGLLAVLTPEQKAQAEQLLAPPRGLRGQPGPHGGPGRGEHGEHHRHQRGDGPRAG